MTTAWRLPAVRWPTLLLMVSLALTTAGVVEANRAIRSQRAVAEHALQDYAGFAAWSYEQHLRDALAATTQEALGAVNHGGDMHTNPRIPDGRTLAIYLPWNPRCSCHRPRVGPSPAVYFGWVLGADTLSVGVNSRADPSEGWEMDRALPMAAPTTTDGYSLAERRWLVDTLTRQIRGGRDNGRFPIVVLTRDSAARLFAYTLMPTGWGDTVVYGAEYSRREFTGLLAEVMYDKGLLPASFVRGHPVREVVQIRVSDASGAPLFESEPVREWRLDDTTRLAPPFGSLLVRAQIRPELAGNLVIGGLPRSRLPFLIALLVVAAALSLVAVGQIRREGELARMRADFVDSISHELRTPLAQMRLYLETLRLGRFTTDAQRAWSLDNVERETTRLAHLVERVLRFSRSGRRGELGDAADDARRPVDAAAEVARIVDEFRPLADARRATLELRVDPAVPPLALRPDALRHVLLNLLDNAVKYGPAGQTVRVAVHAPQDDSHEVRIEVSDEGPGVAASERSAVWRPYQRGRAARDVAGSGIGLAIVRDVVEQQHGGRVWITDSRGGDDRGTAGATFVVTFPAAAVGGRRRAVGEPANAPTAEPALR